MYINVIGAGLAGCEAAMQIANRGIEVHLYEMKPQKYSPAHHYSGFAELAKKLRYEPSWLSREIKRRTGKTYTQLVQEKRLSQAAFLLRNTQRNVSEISIAVGYDNISYFHRIFEKVYGKSPRHYRLQERSLFQKL